jgi:hypothetical protein
MGVLASVQNTLQVHFFVYFVTQSVSQIMQCQVVEFLNSDELEYQDGPCPAEIPNRESSGQNSTALLLYQPPGRHVKSGNILYCNGTLLQERVITSDWTEDIR